MCFTGRPQVKTIRYQCIGTLNGHEECVHSLSLTERGDLLASGGMQVTVDWKHVLTMHCRFGWNSNLVHEEPVAIESPQVQSCTAGGRDMPSMDHMFLQC